MSFESGLKKKNEGLKKTEQSLHYEWIAESMVWGVVSTIVLMFLSMPIYAIVAAGVSKASLDFIKSYFVTLFPEFPYWAGEYLSWFGTSFVEPGPRTAVALLPIMMGFCVAVIGIKRNPYPNNPRDKTRGRMAYDDDVQAMGLLDGFIMVLGLWNGIKKKNKFLKLKETLSALVIAPPGTGKTTGIVVPTIFETDDVSMIVNDVKPEICDLTSGYRSKKSLCFRLEWAAEDNPEKGKFYPRWNPISPRSMPPRGPQRDLYIDRLCNVAVEEPKGDADPHWTNKGRAALTGFIHFMSNKIEAGNYDGIPEQWYGEEVSLPMLLDWITEALLSASDEIDKMREKDPNSALFADPVRDFLNKAVREARQGKYDTRCILEMTQLANTPDKERGSILSTMDAGLTIFKNSAVRGRTCKSDFSFKDVRGMLDPTDGKVKPVTIYMVVNQEDAKALSVITGLFVELLSAWLIAHKPNMVKHDGTKIGPFPALFVLDEFPQMPKLRALLDGPAVGRGQKVSYLMIAQDLGQVQETYGHDATETLMGTTAAKVIFTLTNTKTAERFQDMMGETQGLNAGSWNKDYGLDAIKNMMSKSQSHEWVTYNQWSAADLLNIPFGKQLLIMQGWTQRPIMADTPFYFKHPRFKHMVDPENGGKIPPAPPMPEFLVERRLKEEGYVEIADATDPDALAKAAAAAAGGDDKTVSKPGNKSGKKSGKEDSSDIVLH